MIIQDKAVLGEFRAARRCEVCGSDWMSGPHHWRSKGACRLDVRINLIALCVTCHNGFHSNGIPSRDQLLAVIALRERRKPDEIRDELDELARTPGKIVNGKRIK